MAAQGLLSSSQTINFQPSHHTFDLRMLVLCCAPCKTSPPAASKSIWGGCGQLVCKLLLPPNHAPQKWREISSHPELLSFMVISIHRSLQIPKSLLASLFIVRQSRFGYFYGAEGVSTQLEVNWFWPMKLEVPSMLKVIFTGTETCCEFKALEQKVAVLWILFTGFVFLG